MDTTNPLLSPKCVFDMEKLPKELRSMTSHAFVLVLRAGFDLASDLTHKYELALETTYQALYHLTTDKRWDPKEGPLRDHFLRLIPPAYRFLRYGSREEKEAVFAHARGTRSPSPEDIAIRFEEEPDRERDDARREAVVATVRANVDHHELAKRVAGVWETHGNISPREIAEMLNVTRSAVYNAIALLRYHGDEVRRARRKQGDQS